MKIRTLKQALAEAVRRFGKKGGAGDNGPKYPNVFTTSRGTKYRQSRYKVGAGFMGIAFEVKGEGDSWDEAFAEAALKELYSAATSARTRRQRESRDFVCLENEGRCRKQQLHDRAVEKAWEKHRKAEERWGFGANAERKAYYAAVDAGQVPSHPRALCPLHDGHEAHDAVLAPAMKALREAQEELGWREYEKRNAALEEVK